MGRAGPLAGGHHWRSYCEQCRGYYGLPPYDYGYPYRHYGYRYRSYG
jgi:hypothetical protein